MCNCFGCNNLHMGNQLLILFYQNNKSIVRFFSSATSMDFRRISFLISHDFSIYRSQKLLPIYWTSQGWDLFLRRLLNDWKVERVALLLEKLGGSSGISTEPDRILWKHLAKMGVLQSTMHTKEKCKICQGDHNTNGAPSGKAWHLLRWSASHG